MLFQKLLLSITIVLMLQQSSVINCQKNHRHKRAIKTYSEYLESIKSLLFKNSDINSEMIAFGLAKSRQNSIKIKAWIKKRSHLIQNNIACSPKALLWTDDDFYSNNIRPVELDFSSDELFYCGQRDTAQNTSVPNIYQTKLVFGNEGYNVLHQLGSKKITKIQIKFECKKNLYIDSLCIGINELSWQTDSINTKSFCIDEDIVNYCFLDTYTGRFMFSEKDDYSLTLTNLNEIQRGLENIGKNSYDQYIDNICDNIQLDAVSDSRNCTCNAKEWNRQKKSNNNVFFVGFVPEEDKVFLDPTKCTQKV